MYNTQKLIFQVLWNDLAWEWLSSTTFELCQQLPEDQDLWGVLCTLGIIWKLLQYWKFAEAFQMIYQIFLLEFITFFMPSLQS